MEEQNSISRLLIRCFGRLRQPTTGIVLTFALLFSNPAGAGELAKPKGDVLLVVKGAISHTNVGDEARFDRELFESIGMTKIVTRTPWHDNETEFEGVLGRDLMKAVGATGTTVSAMAANEYRVMIPLSDFENFNVLFATAIDGETLRLRTKGPIWLIYPDGVDVAVDQRRERMIWQLVELEIK